MRAIKGVVIGMGVLIVAGFVVVAVTLVTRMQGSSNPNAPYRTSISLPQGASILETSAGERTTVLRYAAADRSIWLLMIDNGTGGERGRVKLLPETP